MSKLYELLMEPSYRQMLIDMGATDKIIYRRMKKRILQSLAIFIIISLSYFIFKASWILLLALGVSLIVYLNDLKQLKNKHRLFSFEQELQFSKFARLIGPYLKKNEGNTPLYAVFNAVLPRLNDGMQKEVYRLMSEMMAAPNDTTPFISFAKRMGDSDFAVTFMISLFDYQNSTNDLTVIDELVQMANQTLMKNIDTIIDYKLSKFKFVPTIFTVSAIILLLGFFVAMLIQTGQQIGVYSNFLNK